MPPRRSKHRTQLQHVTTRYTLVDCLNWLLLLWLPDLDPEPCLEPDPGWDPVLPLLLWSHSSWKQQTGCFSQGQLGPTHSKTTDLVGWESSSSQATRACTYRTTPMTSILIVGLPLSPLTCSIYTLQRGGTAGGSGKGKIWPQCASVCMGKNNTYLLYLHED